MLMRLNKFLADNGVASRRKADELIESGEVFVNGKRVFELGIKVDPNQDKVKVNGKLVHVEKNNKVYILFYKPKEVITSLKDPEGRPCVGDFFADRKERLYPIGRLDWDSEGMLLLTNDGEFANKVSHPRHKVRKKYLVKINGKISNQQMDKLRNGVSIPNGGRVQAKFLKRLRGKSTDKNDWLELDITEGKNRQIRKMFAKLEFDVLKLKRIAIGKLELGNMKPGASKVLSDNDIKKIFSDPLKSKKPGRQKSKKIVHD
tara:strand:- start:18770 stop:19549 length:780 start_codon:yes stop_codon:yes gene_type:complete